MEHSLYCDGALTVAPDGALTVAPDGASQVERLPCA